MKRQDIAAFLRGSMALLLILALLCLVFPFPGCPGGLLSGMQIKAGADEGGGGSGFSRETAVVAENSSSQITAFLGSANGQRLCRRQPAPGCRAFQKAFTSRGACRPGVTTPGPAVQIPLHLVWRFNLPPSPADEDLPS